MEARRRLVRDEGGAPVEVVGIVRDISDRMRLEEQGMIDGLSRLGALFRIVLPLSAPGLAAVAIFTFTGAWNELLLALVLITSESRRTAPLALNYLITSDVLPWGPSWLAPSCPLFL